MLARSPVLHYALCLSLLDVPAATRVLYLDCDTFFLGDVDALFERYAELDVYGRAEPGSRCSHFGNDPALVDEDALAELVSSEVSSEVLQEGTGTALPFNNGVMLFNHGAWRALAAALEGLFDSVFRFTVGLAIRPGAERERDVLHLREHRD